MSETKRTAAIIGAGLAGTSAALGLLDAGFAVTLYSDKDQKTLRDGVPATGTAIYFGKPSQDADAEIIENLYGADTFATGYSFRIYDASKGPTLEFDPEIVHFLAQGIDVRKRSDDRLTRFIARGGDFRVEPVTLESLDVIAARHDLTLVATGKYGLTDLFPIDETRTVYKTVQRHLLTVQLAGLDYGPDSFNYRSRGGGKHDHVNLHTGFGEIFFGPLVHKDVANGWVILGFANPGKEWVQRFDTAVDAASARQVFLDIFRDYFPEDLPEVEKLQLIPSDSHAWLKGAVTPSVRRAVGFTRSGHPVAALGDAAIIFDPIAGQGAQNVSIQIAALLRAVRAHEGPFTAEWISRQFDLHWQNHGFAATEVTRLFLGDPKYAVHLELLLPAAAVSEGAARAVFRLLSEPELLEKIQTREEVEHYITQAAGEPIADLLARFKPAGVFSRREAA
ncbi:monooxygenase [Betaproteobacteria bacterium]|nr:monooxygenase [Betaproteobacteria bacterium]GHU21156.1 monooxygenase [Betaproteobacteria bacterium]